MIGKLFCNSLSKKIISYPGYFGRVSNNIRFYSNKDDNGDSDTINRIPIFEKTTCAPLKKIEHVNITDASFRLGLSGSKKSADFYDFPYYCDVVIIGGGIIGSSIAYSLQEKSRDGLRIVVVERDPTYSRASTVLSAGGLRQQFSLPENIQMSLFGAEFLRRSQELLAVEGQETPDVQFHPHGYLFLATKKGAEKLEANSKLQNELGAKTELLTKGQLQRKFPWINTENIELGCYGLENEGWFDPWALLEGFRRKAISLGTKYVKGEVVGFERTVDGQAVHPATGLGEYERLRKVFVRMDSGEVRPINFAIAIIAAGAQSGDVARMAGIGLGTGLLRPPLPVEPRKRYIYCYHCPEGPGLDCPLVIDPSGTYFRREGLGGHYIAGKSPAAHEEPGISNLDVDYTFFEQQVWPELANRVPSFEKLKLKSAWAGYYDYNTFDQNAIIGFHPYHTNLMFATGFSGHGIQQAPAAGRAVMESIIYGEYKTINVDRFSFNRVISNDPVFEENIV